MQAILTRYLGPTNHRGSRIKAKCDAMSLTVDWDHSRDVIDNHKIAALVLAQKLGWDRGIPSYIGSIPSGDYVTVFSHQHQQVTSGSALHAELPSGL